MRKYLLPSALILALGLGVAVAQNINKAIQLSQDPTGAFGVDTNNNVYFPGHQLTVGPGTPTLTLCGTAGAGGPLVSGTDTAGQVNTGAAAGTCTMTFNKAYLAAPNCVISWQATPPTTQTNTTVTTSLVMGMTNVNGAQFNYFCTGPK